MFRKLEENVQYIIQWKALCLFCQTSATSLPTRHSRERDGYDARETITADLCTLWPLT